ncbi:MAG: hypothetical protein WCO50_02860, partial [Synechococcus sp. ELA619]
ELRELALHLIATHHGHARPSIPAHDEGEIFADALEQDALEAALRYVRMQRRWGPWGLAWLEAPPGRQDSPLPGKGFDHQNLLPQANQSPDQPGVWQPRTP